MNPLKKERMKATFKYTWPIYLISSILITFFMIFIFRVTHKTPGYKTLTVFVSGEVTNDKKLTSDIVLKYKDKGLENFSYIDADPTDLIYYSKLTIPGFSSADIFIMPLSYLEKIDMTDIAIDINENLIAEYYSGYTMYQINDLNYGIKLNKDKVNEYMTLPNEDCYMFISGRSENIGEYNKKPNKDHDVALNVVKDWGM